MPDLDALVPNYRQAQQRWPDAPTLAKGQLRMTGAGPATRYEVVRS